MRRDFDSSVLSHARNMHKIILFRKDEGEGCALIYRGVDLDLDMKSVCSFFVK